MADRNPSSLPGDLSTLAQSLWAVSTSPPMPRHPEYVDRVEASRCAGAVTHGSAGEMLAGLERTAEARPPTGDPAELPWAPGTRLRVRRAFPALVSFVDDYRGPYPQELFPPAPMRALAGAIAARHRAESRPLTVDRQLDEALQMTAGRLLPAAVLLHAVTRQLARGRDRRACPGLHSTLEDRLAAGEAIAPFAPEISRGGDPLGDTYHYWAMLAGGLHHVLARRDGWIAPGLMLGMFYLGPRLMRLVRQELFGRTLFFGDHLHVDRLGLWHGLSLGHRLRFREASSASPGSS